MSASRRWLPFTLSLIPFLFLCLWVARYHVKCPVTDEWTLAPLLDKSYEGSVSLSDLWAQHNEHRPFFPRVILLLLARATRWNLSYELAFNIVLGAAIFFTWWTQVKITVADQHAESTIWLAPILSLMVFSLGQSENWISGWQMQIFLSVLAAIGGLILLTNGGESWLRFAAAVLLGFVATYSFAGGACFWAAGLIPLVLAFSSKRKMLQVTLWIVAAAAAISAYFYHYHKPEYHPSLSVIFTQPLSYFYYVLSYLGSPLAAFSKKFPLLADQMRQKGWHSTALLLSLGTDAPFFAGLAGVYLLGYAWRKSAQSGLHTRERMLLLLTASFYSISNALLSGLGRAGFGAANALSLRYVTLSLPFWISLTVLLHRLAAARSRPAKTAVAVIVLLVILNSVYGAAYAKKQYNSLYPAQQELFSLKDDHLLGRLYFDPKQLRKLVEILKRYHLSVFREES